MSFIGSVLEIISIPETLNYEETEDICYRSSGQLILFPQTEEEMDQMDNVLWDYAIQKAGNNVSVLENLNARGGEYPWFANTRAMVGGHTPAIDDETMKEKQGAAYDPREGTYPNNGEIDLVHPLTGKPLNPYGKGPILWPLGIASYKYPTYRVMCLMSMRKRLLGTYWWDRLTPLCYTETTEGKENGNPMCAFHKNPTFRKASMKIQNCHNPNSTTTQLNLK